jgi:hypothetical protein
LLVVPLGQAQQKAPARSVVAKPKLAAPLRRVKKPRKLDAKEYQAILRAHDKRARAKPVRTTARANTRVAFKSQNHAFRGERDCDDSNRAINPGANEVCDEVDNDCDGNVDEGVSRVLYLDADGDEWGDPRRTLRGCPGKEGYATRSNDCDDSNPTIYPGAGEEPGNGTDDNCDGEVK